MSVRYLTSVWDHADAGGTDLLVLLALADNANEDTGYAWPSVETLARKTRVSPRTVQRSLRSLEEAGQIALVRPGGRLGGQNRAAVYKLTPQGCQSDTPDRPGVTSRDDRGDIQGRIGVSPVSPQPSIEPSEEPSDTAAALRLVEEPPRRPAAVGKRKVSDAEHDLCDAILAAFNATAGTKFAAVEFREKIIRRVREHPELTADDHRGLIERNFRAPWWNGDPSPAVIYGNGGIFERSISCRGEPNAMSPRDGAAKERQAMGRESRAALQRLTGRSF